MSEPYHIPVMVERVIDYLNVVKDGLYVDCTLGGGGHSQALLEKGGIVIGIDRDPEAIEYSRNRLKRYNDRFTARVGRFSHIAEITGSNSGKVNGVLMDLGISSKMIDNPARGFSFMSDGPLLMNMSGDGATARDIINTMSIEELARIFREYGEERFARKIANAIVQSRSLHPIDTTHQLAEIVEKAVGGKMPQKSKARIFQALRIYINDEINELNTGLTGAVTVLKPGGRICVISYHSIEDRVVKQFIKNGSNPCICPPGIPVCKCNQVASLKMVTRKPIKASAHEIIENVRARSAHLRVAEKVTGE